MREETVFFRCVLCHSVVSPWDIEKGGCQKCGGVRIKPTKLSLFEIAKQVILHPRVWAWPINPINGG